MGYIRKNVNFFLVLLLIIVLGSMAALSLYYRATYRELSVNYSQSIGEQGRLRSNIASLNSTLLLQAAQISQIQDELRLKTEVKQKFDVLYTNVTSSNERLSIDLAQTKSELQDALSRLKKAQADLDSANSELSVTKSSLLTQLNYTRDLESQVSALRSQVCSLKVRLNETC